MSSRPLIHVCDLASGGMGRVEVALRKEARFERLFAVKRLHDHYASITEAQDMFLDEGRIAGLIRHPHVVHVVDVGRDDDGPFLVMEYVEGLPLSKIIRHHAVSVDLIPLPVGLEIIRQAALGLHAAHEVKDKNGVRVGLIHRDVSPQNILVSYDGFARLTDFGIAKASEHLTETQTGVLKGKMGYLSPEQLRFEDATQASDLFALGVVLYETLSSERLYGPGNDAARRILHDPPPDLADLREDVPDEVIGLVFRLLAKDPADRCASAKEVADVLGASLRQLADGEAIDLPTYMRSHHTKAVEAQRARVAEGLLKSSTVGPSPSSTGATLLDPRPRRVLKIALAALGVVLCVLVGLAVWPGSSSDGPEEPITVPAADSEPELMQAPSGEMGADPAVVTAAEPSEEVLASPDEQAEQAEQAEQSEHGLEPERVPSMRPRARRGRGAQRDMSGQMWVGEW